MIARGISMGIVAPLDNGVGFVQLVFAVIACFMLKVGEFSYLVELDIRDL